MQELEVRILGSPLGVVLEGESPRGADRQRNSEEGPLTF